MLIDGDPQRLGGYWLAGRLGAGGQGVVYEAYAEDGRRVAVKVLHGDQASQLAREAAAAQRVAEFCTAPVIEARLDGPRPYIVSEYVEGPSLRRAVAGGRRFTGGDLHRLATAVATALTAIHDAEVIHRDMKPDNVLLGPDGPRVIDFGVARTAEMSLTATGLVTGTPTYMAPEVFGGHRAGMPADVFAWGGIVLYAATGEDPFHAESLGGVMHRVLSDNPDLSVLPASLRVLVAAALAKEPLERPTARQLLLSLVSGDARAETEQLLAQGGREAAHIGVAADDPALGTLAEDAYGLLSTEEQELAAEVFLRLVTVDEQGRLSVRRASVSELVEGRALPDVASITRILQVFGYLLGREEEAVWLLRPALPHAWPRFRRWVEANRDGLPVHKEILAGARRWERAGRRDGALLQGISLENALQWAATARRNITLSPAERDFLAASAALTRRRARRNRLLAVSLAGLLVIALVAAGLAVQQGRLADERAGRIAAQRDQAEAARLAQLADTLRQSDPRAAMLLSVAAWRLHGTPQTRAALTAALAQREVAMFKDPAASGDVVRVLGRDGRTLASVSDDAVRLWDVRTGRRAGGIAKLGLAGEGVLAAALSPSGREVLVATERQARVWNLRTGQVIGSWAHRAGQDVPVNVRYGTVDRYPVFLIDGVYHLWDLKTGRRIRTAKGLGPMTPSGDAVYAESGGRVERLSLPGLAVTGMRPYADRCATCGRPVAVSPDGRSLLEPLRRGLQETSLADGRSGALGQDGPNVWNRGEVIFSHDGHLLASMTWTGIQVWRGDGEHLTTLPLTSGSEFDTAPFPQAAFDGGTLRYLNEDRVFTVDLSDLATRAPKTAVSWAWARLGPGARQLLAGEDLTTVLLGDPRRALGGAVLKRPDSDGIEGAAFSGDGRLAAVGGSESITVLDVATRRAVATWKYAQPAAPQFLAFNPDGTRLAAASERGAVTVWDWRSRRLVWKAGVEGVRDVEFSPDGRTLAVAADAQRLFDSASGKSLGSPFGGTGRGTTVTDVVFTRDSRSVAIADTRGRVTVYDAATRRPVGPVARGELNGGDVAARSPREDVIAIGTQGGRVQLFDLTAGTSLGMLRDGNLEGLTGLTFSADGSSVLILDGTGAVREQPVAPDKVAAAVCARAGSPLTTAEWGHYITGVPYRRVCP
ncbi:serine/threonine-protein kinase [Nonomuraea sp. B19D2]|uniref:serine/threonine-protein kinase n=1 Tax=Nonomuraea sp. B19D2 TaxID=3159561 RepID=UPI0032DAA251